MFRRLRRWWRRCQLMHEASIEIACCRVFMRHIRLADSDVKRHVLWRRGLEHWNKAKRLLAEAEDL